MRTRFEIHVPAIVPTLLYLAFFAFASGEEGGETEQRASLFFSGTVLDTTSKPLPNAKVQFWQTHPTSGLYDHPNSAGNDVDPTFQYFGTSTTDEDGQFKFTTYKPAPFTYRPPHIHFKVWLDSEEGGGARRNVLTSQFYFREDGTRANDALLLDLGESSDKDGNASLIANKTVVIDVAGMTGGNMVEEALLSATPFQAEGPFYPVVDFFDVDNDLTSVATSDAVETEGGDGDGDGAMSGEKGNDDNEGDEDGEEIEDGNAGTNENIQGRNQSSATSSPDAMSSNLATSPAVAASLMSALPIPMLCVITFVFSSY